MGTSRFQNRLKCALGGHGSAPRNRRAHLSPTPLSFFSKLSSLPPQVSARAFPFTSSPPLSLLSFPLHAAADRTCGAPTFSSLFFSKRKATTPQRASRNAHLATRISPATRILQRASSNAHFATRVSTCDTHCAFCEAQLGSERSERRSEGEGLRAARTYLKQGERSEPCDDELDERRRRRGRKGEGWRAARRAAHLASAECDDQRHGSASAASAAVANKRKGGGRREGKGEGLRASPRCTLRTAHLASAASDEQRHGRASTAASTAMASKRTGGG